LEESRRNVLTLLAASHPAAAVTDFPEKPFHHWLRHYGITPPQRDAELHREFAPFRDDSHPYLHVDMSRCISCYRCVRICAEVQGQFVWHALGRGAETHIVPDGETLLTSSCVSCGACADTCPTGAIEDQSILREGKPERWTRTTCPYCGVGCELLAGARGNRLVQMKPAPDAPVNHGHLCVKGRYAFAFNHSPDRLTTPLLRETDGQRTRWKEIDWPEAIQWLAEKLTAIRARHGADSIGMLGSARGTNEENYLAQKFARVVLGTNNVDGCARVCHQPTATGMKWMLGTGAATNSFADIEAARTFLIFGCNPTENHPIVGARIKQAVRRGAKLIVVDPRRTELAAMANVHLALHPGSNVALLNALANVTLESGWEDQNAIPARVDGLAEFRKFIRAWTPERAAELCGVPAEAIRRAAELYATHRPAMCFHGLGVTEHTQGTDSVMALVNLALLTGNFGRPGTGVNPLRGQNNVQGSAHMGCEPNHLTGFVSLEQGRASFGVAWSTSLPTSPGLNLMQMVDAAAQGKLKALWAIGYDILHTNPNATATRAALRSLDVVVVQDLFLNELARECAHLVLPAASAYEKDGTFMNAERRVQRVRAVVPPPGHAKADWEILCEVARAMGHGNQFSFRHAGEIWDEIRSVWPAGAGISYARLEHGGLQWPCPTEAHPGTTILHAERFPVGPRATLRCIAYEATTEQISAEFPFRLTTGRTLYQFNAGTMTRRTANRELHPEDYLDMAPDDAERMRLKTGDRVRVVSRHGEGKLPVRVNDALPAGQLFATFHVVESGLNDVTSPHRDRHEGTPEYKVVAVRVERE
jgi:formate dehydrogenase major subunit